MATNKSAIRQHILDFAGDRSVFEHTWKGAYPKQEQCEWKRWQRRVITHDARRVHVHTLIDGYQTTQHLNEKAFSGEHDENGKPMFMQKTWAEARAHYVQWVRNWLFVDLGLHTQRLVLAFDNGAEGSLAKRATQLKRRADTMRGAYKKKHRVKLRGSPDEIECAPIDARERIPYDWRTLSLWGKYRARIHEFMLDPLLLHGERAYENDATSEFYAWYGGRAYAPTVDEDDDDAMGDDYSTPPRDADKRRWTEDDEVTRRFAHMGEYDFFVLRYAVETLEAAVASRKRTMDVEDVDDCTEEERDAIHNFSNLVFRVVTTDTDLLLYALWLMEYVQTRFRVSPANLPCVFCVSPWAPGNNGLAYVISVKRLYMELKEALRALHNSVGYSVRSFVCNFLAWGNDILRSPRGITARTALDAYVKFNPALPPEALSVCLPYPRASSSPHAVRLNGVAFRLLFALWYGIKYAWPDGVERDDIEEQFRDATVDAVENHVYDACMGRVKDVRKNALSPKNRMPHPESGVMENRLGLFAFSVYSVEHALKCRPNYTRSLRDVGLLGAQTPGSDGSLPFYHDLYDVMCDVLTDRQKRLLGALGLFGEGRFFRWNDVLMQDGDAPYDNDNGAIRALAEKAECVFSWPGLD